MPNTEVHYIDQQIKHITLTSPSVQLSIDNQSKSPLYVNYDGSTPNSTDFDFYVAPLSVRLSAVHRTTDYTIYAPNFQSNDKRAVIKTSSVGLGSPTAVGNEQFQLSSVAGYPYIVNLNDVTTWALPQFTINEYKRFIFVVNSTPEGCYLVFSPNINIIPSAGGNIAIFPRVVPFTFNGSLNFPSTSAVTVKVDVFQSDTVEELLFHTNPLNTVMVIGNGGSSVNYDAAELAFIFGIIARPDSGTTITITALIEIYSAATGGYVTYKSITITKNVVAGIYSVVLEPELYLLDLPSLVKITITNNTGVGIRVKPRFNAID
jgi:hypothetical protein